MKFYSMYSAPLFPEISWCSLVRRGVVYAIKRYDPWDSVKNTVSLFLISNMITV